MQTLRRRTPPPTVSARGVGAFAAGSLTGFVLSWNLTNTGAIAPVLGRHYGVGLVVVGALTSIAFLAELAIMIPGGRAIDRWGARRVALASLAVCVVGNALLLVIPTVYAALFLRWLIGFGVGAGFVAGSVWITAEARGRSALGQGIFGGISLAGAGVATAVVPLLQGPLGWRSSYWTGLAVAAIGLLVVATSPATVRPDAHSATPLRRLIAHPVIARLGALHSASFASSVIAGNWVVTLLTRQLHLSYGSAGLRGGLTLLLGIVGRPLGGWATERYPRHRFALLVASLVAAGTATAVLGFSGSVALDTLAAAVLGLAFGIPFGAIVHTAASAFPRAPGEAIGATNLYAVAAIIIGTPLVGATFSLPGDGRIGFAVLAAIAFLAIAVVSRSMFNEPATERA